MPVYIFHLHDFSIIYLQGYNLAFVDIMSPVCDSVVFYFYIYLQYTKVPVIHSQALTLPSFMICYHLTKFSWYMAMAVIFFPSLYCAKLF